MELHLNNSISKPYSKHVAQLVDSTRENQKDDRKHKCQVRISFCNLIILEFPKVHFGKVFTGLNVAAKSMLQKIEVFTRDYLADYQLVYTFQTKTNEHLNENAEKSCAIYLNR